LHIGIFGFPHFCRLGFLVGLGFFRCKLSSQCKDEDDGSCAFIVYGGGKMVEKTKVDDDEEEQNSEWILMY